MALPNVLQRVLDWLHAGYPEGVPQQDYYPLLAFLTRQMSTDDVVEVVGALKEEREVPEDRPPSEDVREALEAVTNSQVLEEDIRRIEEYLRNRGWESESPSDG
jgi:uncharacterized protein DUF3349